MSAAVDDIQWGHEQVRFKAHLGGYVMATATSDLSLISICQYFQPEDVNEPVPTKRGVSFYVGSWGKVVEILQECRDALGDLYDVTKTCLDADIH